MSIISSFFIGASGLTANGLELSVVGDNIANSNTIAFKGSRAVFEDVLGLQLTGGEGEFGAGTRLQEVQLLLTQGVIAQTGVATDLAMQGNGLFIVKGNDGSPLYTRAGQFTIDQDGFLVNLDSLRVQGFKADVAGNINSAIGDIDLAGATSPPSATTNATLRGNLTANPDEPIKPPFDALNPAGTSNFSTALQVFDSLGNPHEVDVHFRLASAGVWEWHATTNGDELDGGVAGIALEIGTGQLSFNASGNLQDVTGDSISLDPIGSPTLQTLTINFGDAINNGGTGTIGMVQQSTIASSINFVSQNGFGAGAIAGVQINEFGVIIGAFTNGQSRALGQVAVAAFEAPDQLDRIGGNLFRASSFQAGEANIGSAGTGGRGSIIAGALEQSNVDLSGEFIRMIIAQRAFQASSKTVQTADQLLNELIQIKR